MAGGVWAAGIRKGWCENLFKDDIKSQFDSISDLMTETFHKTTEDGGLISTFLTGHPASFSGSASDGTTIWSTIETLCNNVVVPIGGFILVIILLNDLIQTVIRGNNFKDFDNSIFIKWIIKALCGVILVSNVFYIASALFSFGTDACANGITTLFGTGDFLSTDLALKKSALNSLGLGELITVWFISMGGTSQLQLLGRRKRGNRYVLQSGKRCLYLQRQTIQISFQTHRLYI